MSKEEQDVPIRDPRLAKLLRLAEGDAGLDQAERSELRARIAAAAELPLARRRGARAISGIGPRRQRVIRSLAPLAAVAGLATLVWVGLDRQSGEPGARSDLAEISTLEEAFVADLSEQEFRAFVSGRANSDELLLLAAGEG